MAKTRGFLFTAGIALATTFTLSCSGEEASLEDEAYREEIPMPIEKGEAGEKGDKGDTGEKGADGMNGMNGTNCSVRDDGAYYVMKCGTDEVKLAKAMCGTAAYDPKAYLCKRGVLKPLCGAVTYEPEIEACKDGAVKPLCKPVYKTLAYEQVAVAYDPEEGQTCENGIVKSIFIDSRDGQAYKSVKIFEQTWMAENLKYNPNTGSSVCYKNDCSIYGRYYNWATAMDFSETCNNDICSSEIKSPHQGICPEGWHIPSEKDWKALINLAGSENFAGLRLKTESGWKACSNCANPVKGWDEFGFSALSGGALLADGTSYYISEESYMWSSSEQAAVGAYGVRLLYSAAVALWGGFNKPSYHMSIRCVKD